MSTNQFYNRYDPSKRYHFWRALSGRAPQSAEFNEIQSYAQDMLARLGGALFKNGTILSGCSIIRQANTVTITAGTVFLSGKVFPVDAAVIDLASNESATLSMYIVSSIVVAGDVASATVDPALKDPAIGRPNYGKPGADREKLVVQWTKEAVAGAVPVFVFHNGELLTEGPRQEVDLVTKTLARRTYEESGNYLIDGLRVAIREHGTDVTKIIPSITAGKAVVKGFEITRSISSDLDALDKAITGRADSAILTYNAAGTGTPAVANKFVLRSDRVIKSVSSVKVTYQTTITGISHTGNDSVDVIPMTGQSDIGTPKVTKIISVLANGVTYLPAGGKFTLVENENQISWVGGGNVDNTDEPAIGQSYQATVEVTGTLPASKFSVDEALNRLDLTQAAAMAGRTLVAGSRIDVSFEYYLARTDLMELLPDGTISIKRGQPDIPAYAPLPTAEALPLAELRLPPGKTILYAPDPADQTKPYAEVINLGLYRVTQRELRELIQRLERQELETAAEDLNNIAVQRGGTTVKGAFSDGFISAQKIDMGSDGLLSDAEIDVARGEMRLAQTVSVAYPKPDSVPASGKVTAAVDRNLAILPYDPNAAGNRTEPVKASTSIVRLNPYGNFSDKPALVVFANEDLFQETNVSALPVEARRDAKFLRGVWGEVPAIEVANVSAIKQAQEAISAYSVSRTVTLKGANYGANANNLIARLNGKIGRLVPAGSTQAGNTLVGFAELELNLEPTFDKPTVGNLVKVTLDNITVTTTVLAADDTVEKVVTRVVSDINATSAVNGFRSKLQSNASAAGNLITLTLKSDIETAPLTWVVEDGGSTGLSMSLVANETGTVKANAAGAFEATFSVPNLVPAGERQIAVANTTKSASARYVVRSAKDAVIGETPVLEFAASAQSAVAQTFTATVNPLLGVGVFFTAADATLPVEVQIREVVNGRPTNKVLARKVLFAANVLLPTDVSSDAKKLETVRETKVVFDTPVVSLPGTVLAVVLHTGAVGSSNAGWHVAVAETGQVDRITGAVINSNPYAGGAFFVGAGTWDEQPASDLKHALYEAIPTASTAHVEFDPVAAAGATGMILKVAQGVTADARIDWEYRLDPTGLWKPLMPGTHTEFEAAATNVYLKATLSGSNGKTPWVNIGAMALVLGTRKVSGTYESVVVPYSQGYQNVTVYVQVQQTPGQQQLDLDNLIKVRPPNDMTGAWVTLVKQPTTTVTPDGFIEYQYKNSVAMTSGTNFKLQVNMAAPGGVTPNPAFTPKLRRLVTYVS